MQADIKTDGDDTLVINGHKIKCVSGKGLTPITKVLIGFCGSALLPGALMITFFAPAAI